MIYAIDLTTMARMQQRIKIEKKYKCKINQAAEDQRHCLRAPLSFPLFVYGITCT